MAHAYLPINVSEKAEEYEEVHSIIWSGGEERGKKKIKGDL
jgi:hypothetical protein